MIVTFRATSKTGRPPDELALLVEEEKARPRRPEIWRRDSSKTVFNMRSAIYTLICNQLCINLRSSIKSDHYRPTILIDGHHIGSKLTQETFSARDHVPISRILGRVKIGCPKLGKIRIVYPHDLRSAL